MIVKRKVGRNPNSDERNVPRTLQNDTQENPIKYLVQL